MKREIEFRGKRIDNGNWHHGNYVDGVDSKCYIMDFASVETDAFSFFEVTPESVCEFTGLRDRRGKKIFEGDVVKWGHLNLHSAENPIRIAVVKIDPDIQFEIIDRPHYQLCFLEKHHIFHFGSFAYANTTERDLEIIGNVFENPELL